MAITYLKPLSLRGAFPSAIHLDSYPRESILPTKLKQKANVKLPASVQGILSFRCWNLHQEIDLKVSLRSTGVEFTWPSKIVHTSVPARDDANGIYSLSSIKAVEDRGIGDRVGGIIESTGHIIQYEDGTLRSEVAEILLLVVSTDVSLTVARRLSDIYDVLVVRSNSPIATLNRLVAENQPLFDASNKLLADLPDIPSEPSLIPEDVWETKQEHSDVLTIDHLNQMQAYITSPPITNWVSQYYIKMP